MTLIPNTPPAVPAAPTAEALLDAVIADALGSATPADRALLVTPTPAAAQIADTTACLAAASPFLAPPATLRAAILAATGPKNFKLEDYRRANAEPNYYLRLGLIAATVALIASAWYTMTLKSQLNEVANAYTASQDSQQKALILLTDPTVPQVNVLEKQSDGSDKPIGKLLVDAANNDVMIVLPTLAIAPGEEKHLLIDLNGQKTQITARGAGGKYFIGTAHRKTQLPDHPIYAKMY